MDSIDRKEQPDERENSVPTELRLALLGLARRMSDADTFTSVGGDVIPRIKLSPENMTEVGTNLERSL